MTLWAMSFPEWRCVDCRLVVHWVDAVTVYDERGKEVGVRHLACDAHGDDA